MTGPEHYRLAELLLESCQIGADYRHPDDAPTYPPVEYSDEAKGFINTIGNALAAAQVHATLALAAATALGTDPEGRPLVVDGGQWAVVT